MKPGRLEEIVYNLLKSYELPSFLQTLEREQRIEETTPAAQLDWQNNAIAMQSCANMFSNVCTAPIDIEMLLDTPNNIELYLNSSL